MPTPSISNGRPSVPELDDLTTAELTRTFGEKGLSIFGGFVQEEYLSALRPWSREVRIYLEMQNDPVIGALLEAIKLPLLAADFDVTPFSEAPGDLAARDFLWDVMNGMERQTFRAFAEDQLEALDFGFAVGEITLEKRSDGRLWIQNIDPRGQETLHRWVMDPEQPDRVVAMEQGSFRGTTIHGGNKIVPLAKTVHAVFRGRKGNPQGRSLLRSLYRPWRFKVNLENLEGIGIERNVGGMPVITMPEEPQTGADMTALDDAAKNLRTDEQMFIRLPFGYKLEAYTGGYTNEARAVIEAKNTEILMRFFAQFLKLGMESTGAFALVKGAQQFFNLGLESVQQRLVDTWNQQLVPFLFRFNAFAGMTGLPLIKWNQPGAVDLEALMKAMETGVKNKILTRLREDEEYVRAEADLPDLPEDQGMQDRNPPEPVPVMINGAPPRGPGLVPGVSPQEEGEQT